MKVVTTLLIFMGILITDCYAIGPNEITSLRFGNAVVKVGDEYSDKARYVKKVTKIVDIVNTYNVKIQTRYDIISTSKKKVSIYVSNDGFITNMQEYQ